METGSAKWPGVPGLSSSLGGRLEDTACELVPELLEKPWDMTILSSRPEDVTVGRHTV